MLKNKNYILIVQQKRQFVKYLVKPLKMQICFYVFYMVKSKKLYYGIQKLKKYSGRNNFYIVI